MQFSFLGYSVNKIMELDLDVKDVTILRFFDDFRQSGRMNYEVIDGVKYYWVSYQNIENELPFLGLGKRTIMMRMLKLRDLGILSHYTKKEGGTFSYYAIGDRYKELLYIKDNDNNNSNSKYKKIGGQANKSDRDNIINEVLEASYNEDINNGYEEVINNEESVFNNVEGNSNFYDFEEGDDKNEERVSQNNHRGYAEKCSTKTNLLNNSSTKVTNIYNNIKEHVNSIIKYLNSKVGVMYKVSSTKTINLVKARLTEGFTIENFITVIDKKVKEWKNTIFEQYLTPFTLFGDKFEVYLNQRIIPRENSNSKYSPSNTYGNYKKLRFDNFKGRDYDYADLEIKLLGWDK
ncbi:conserved phage C-terminal domain-containing protein [Clostridium sp. AL.422]|uniref:conserved phage C-terminal domain-containing protein n=1 Tax=Clostridium TaxID=1485 RepID=UPI00293DBEA7|nr:MULTISPECIES: conserved phage C-terminal domain-containing protein [unclassified Clostridium]MDV4150280.1 conserved phage C-terminal domain-containing protein [Clostridium sp. AL.422]